MESQNDLNTTNKKSHGQLTAEIGKSLVIDGYDVLYGHGISNKKVGKIISYFGDKNERGTQLSYLDIAIVKKGTNHVIALFEIEETANRPKTIIGDIFAFLMGDRVEFQGQVLEIGKSTTLFVLGFSNVQHPKHNQYILEKVDIAKSALGTKNCHIGKVLIETYSDKDKLQSLIMSLLDQALKGEM